MAFPQLKSLTLLAGVAISIPGCSQEAPPAAATVETTPTSPATQNSATGGEAESTPTAPVVSLVRPKLPEDVFFQDPLAIAANTTRAPGTESLVEAKPEMPAPAGSDAEPAEATKEAIAWEEILSADQIHAEMVRIRDRFAPKLDSVANFNASLLELPPYFAEMSALAIIASQHPEDVPWKKDAKFIRDLAAEAVANPLTRGQNSFAQVKGPFDKISLLLDGKPAEDLPESEEEGDFVIASDFGFLMRRLEIGQNSLSTNGSSAAALSKNAAALNQETRVLAALGIVIATEDYGYGDEDAYQNYATEFRDAALEAAKAAEANEFDTFDKSANLMMQNCNNCHQEYRNS